MKKQSSEDLNSDMETESRNNANQRSVHFSDFKYKEKEISIKNIYLKHYQEEDLKLFEDKNQEDEKCKKTKTFSQ